ncbi:autoinducer binding domain-containing protein [Paraburkholderia sp. IMGN_8]|uniref:helix-turn-helix transcriptional regulator n=1 Tax=Paraburkholderia sp. IMGN_8 TaxID=3136564 RepID=UPI003100B6DB
MNGPSVSSPDAPSSPPAADGADPPELIWHKDRDLAADSAARRSGAQSHLIRELASAATPAERMRLFAGLLRIIGFNTVAYVTLQVVQERVARAFMVESLAPAQFRGNYFHERYFEVDPRLAIGRVHTPPVVWDLSQLNKACRSRGRDPRANRFLQEMDADGMRSGIMLGLPVPSTDLQVIVSFTSMNPKQGWIDSSILAQTLGLGLSLHQLAAGYRRTLAKQSEATAVSERQREILLCIASGLSDKQIALRLHTSVHNVDYHLRLLRKTYGVGNRAELAYLAGRLRLN